MNKEQKTKRKGKKKRGFEKLEGENKRKKKITNLNDFKFVK